MKDSFNFDIGEININKNSADKLRESIFSIAQSKFIGTNPIQYELLLKDIKAKMIELSDKIVFTFNGEKVNFKSGNQVIFSTRVLKSLFSDKRESDIITIQSKNLDILSFYAFNKPWTKNVESNEAINQNSNNSEHNDNLQSIKERLNKKLKIFHVLLGMIISCLIIIYLIFITNNLNKDNVSLRNEYEKLLLKHNRSETEYQSVINNVYNPEIFNLHQFNESGYDSLVIPSRPLLFKANFNEVGNVFSNRSSYFFQGVELQPIFIKDSFDVQPGIKTCQILGGEAYGFGKSFCTGDCFLLDSTYNKQNYLCILRISFTKKTYISYMSFRWVEVDGNWGSTGHVYIDGNPKYIGKVPYQYIGIWPASNKISDERHRNFKCEINDFVKYIDIAVWDITYESEIFINNIKVYGR
ncbi:MAG: hypothetical protein A2X61_00235 [Ignavibacteria bacterium GWB2_35_12]|nr:MAG: hypothetical protein A2X61_00235 [Ignavibacteria bacterium GWB2_35_12]OGV23348.1 MAG: hypothetical protein A2475_06810 [Ignavibacteria bacterium RIFOXYC2_FULL_35_21]